MKKRLGEMLRNTGHKLLGGMKRFPEALLLSTAAVILGIYLYHSGAELSEKNRDLLSRIIMTLALGIPLSLCIKTLFERFRRLGTASKLLLYAIGVLCLTLYYLFLLPDFNFVSIARYVGISLALYLTFTFIPYFFRREHYELYMIKLLTSFVITYLYSMILYLGLAAIIFTIDQLFTAHISSKLYFDMFLIVAGIFAPGYFLAGIPAKDAVLSPEQYPKILNVLLLSIVMPLTVVYTAILYVYFIKILITWDWPSGLVANLVLWFSIIAATVIFLVYPLKSLNRWVHHYVNWLPVLLLPLMAMMAVSLGIRVKAYGFTENRYYVAIVGLWVTGCMIFLILRRRTPRNLVLTLSLAIIAVLSVAGPWSSFSVSMYSQNLRLDSVLQRNNMLKDHAITKPTIALKEADKNEIAEVIRYFDRFHSIKNVWYLPKDFTLDKSENLFGFDINAVIPGPRNQATYFNHYLVEESQIYSISGYDYLVEVPYFKQASLSGNGSLTVDYSDATKNLVIRSSGKVLYTGKPEEFARQIHLSHRGIEALQLKDMSIRDDKPEISVLYMFKNINGTEDTAAGNIVVNTPSFNLLIKIK